MKKQKELFQLSDTTLKAIDELKIQHLKKIQNSMADFCYHCGNAGKDSHMLNLAVQRNWQASAKKIIGRINRNLNDFSYQLQRVQQTMNSETGKTPKLNDIYAELCQIQQEYGQLKYDLKEQTLSIITDSISLDDIPFGPFEIRLRISDICQLYSSSPYRVIALDPNPAGSDSCVTHPHVSNDILCEGDGHMPIRRALEDGRLCDFFTIIINILQTYNPDSPYVSLDDWEGVSCCDCGRSVSGDDSYYCEFCDNDYCSQCSTYCQRCDTTTCLGCAYECPDCEEPVCRNCIAVCKQCEGEFCKDCLTEDGLCKSCDQDRKDNTDEQQKSDSTARIAV